MRRLNRTDLLHANDNGLAVQTVEDVTAQADFCAQARNARSSFNPGGGFTLAASIPMSVVCQFANERGIDVHEVMNSDALLAQLLAWAPAFKTIDKSVF